MADCKIPKYVSMRASILRPLDAILLEAVQSRYNVDCRDFPPKNASEVIQMAKLAFKCLIQVFRKRICSHVFAKHLLREVRRQANADLIIALKSK